MAKSGKHKKLRRQEKAKTQLKGKSLAKAQNVIEPKLQTKKILIREQLKEATYEPTEFKKARSFEEILPGLNHHNTNLRLGSLHQLLQLVALDANVLETHLGKIVEKVSALASDPEAEVRTENLKVAEELLSKVSEDQLLPFWEAMMSRLRSALTDLNPAVRKGCLPFMQLLIGYVPKLVELSKSTIIPSLLKLVSTSLSTSSSSKSVQIKVDLSDKCSDVRERVKIFNLINSCLSFQQSEDSEQESVPHRDLSWNMELNMEDAPYGLTYDCGYSDFFCVRQNVCVPNWKWVEYKDGSDNQTVENDEKEEFVIEFSKSCVPLLMQTWVEVAPSAAPYRPAKSTTRKKKQAEVVENTHPTSYLNKPAVEVLECISRMISTCIRICEALDEGMVSADLTPRSFRRSIATSESVMRKFKKLFGQDLRKYFFISLPFSCAQENLQQAMITINLRFFHVGAALRIMDEDAAVKFGKYVRSHLAKESLDAEHVTLSLDIMKKIGTVDTGKLATNFLILVITESKVQATAYDFLNQLLSLTSSNETSNFITAIDWDTLTVKIIEELLSRKSSKLDDAAIRAITLVSIRNLTDVESILKRYPSIIDLKKDCKSEENLKHWDRLFFYANMLNLDETF